MTVSEFYTAHFGCANQHLIWPVVEDVRFGRWPASRQDKHHCRAGGLHDHTLDVLQRVDYMASAPGPVVDKLVLYTAAVWHDAGKMQEYDCKFYNPDDVLGKVDRSARGKLQSHIMIGLEMWAQFRQSSVGLPMSPSQRDHVAHCIGSHHGRKEWGSPLEPLTLEAMMLHHADMQSVMADTGKNPETRQ